MKYNVKYFDVSSDDFERVSDFIMKNSAYIAENTAWSYQRFVDWKYGHLNQYNFENNFWNRTMVIFTDELNKIIGVGINEDDNNVLTILMGVEQGVYFERFFEDAFRMLMQGQSSVVIELSEKQPCEIEVIVNKGYQKVGFSRKMIYDLSEFTAKSKEIISDYRIVSMAEAPLYEQQARLRASAFQGKLDLTDDEVTKRLDQIKLILKSPTYNSLTDLVIIDSDGNAIAGCEPLVNFTTLDAEIERVCTNHKHRDQGLSKTIINEAMSRLKKQGIKRAYLSGWNDLTIHLYESFGPHSTLDIYTFKYMR